MLQKNTGSQTCQPSLRKRKIDMERLKLTLIIIPFFILIVMFRYVPIAGWSMAFVKYRPGMNIFDCKWMGLDNFTMLNVWKNFGWNSIIYFAAITGIDGLVH